MDRNVGGFDLWRGAIVGVLFLLVGVSMLLESLVGAVPVVLGGYLLLTAIARRCPIDRALGVDTSTSG